MSRLVTSRIFVGAVIVLVLIGFLWWSGRGSTMPHRTVRQSIATIASLRAEGKQLDLLVQHGRDLPRTTTVHATELADALDGEAATLGSAQPEPSDRASVTRAIQHAQAAARTLRRLATHPDQSVGAP